MKVFYGVLLLAITSPSSAYGTPPSVYKCAGANGTVVFSQMPCGKDAKQVDTSRALRTGTAPNVQGVSDYAALARIDSDCRLAGDQIAQRYASEMAGVNRQIAVLSNSMRYSNNNLAGATRDSGLQTEIASLNDRKSSIQRLERDDQADLRQRCTHRREEERKAQEARAAASAAAAQPSPPIDAARQ